MEFGCDTVGNAKQQRKHELQPTDSFQDAKRRRAGLGPGNDRPPLGHDAKRSDDRIRPAARSDNSATVRRVRAESAEGADEKVGDIATKQKLKRVDYEETLFPYTVTRS